MRGEAITCFLTGSRVYGAPRPDSDADLAILVDEETRQKLCEIFPEHEKYGSCRAMSIKVGKLDLVVFADAREFRAWKKATEWLTEEKPVSKYRAMQVIHALAGYPMP